MNKSGTFDRVNRSRVTVAAVCLGIFLVMLVCNLWTDLVADDYRYFFSYADESRIESVAESVLLKGSKSLDSGSSR